MAVATGGRASRPRRGQRRRRVVAGESVDGDAKQPVGQLTPRDQASGSARNDEVAISASLRSVVTLTWWMRASRSGKRR